MKSVGSRKNLKKKVGNKKSQRSNPKKSYKGGSPLFSSNKVCDKLEKKKKCLSINLDKILAVDNRYIDNDELTEDFLKPTNESIPSSVTKRSLIEESILEKFNELTFTSQDYFLKFLPTKAESEAYVRLVGSEPPKITVSDTLQLYDRSKPCCIMTGYDLYQDLEEEGQPLTEKKKKYLVFKSKKITAPEFDIKGIKIFTTKFDNLRIIEIEEIPNFTFSCEMKKKKEVLKVSTSKYNTKELYQIKTKLKETLNNNGTLEITYPGANKEVSMSLYKVKNTDNYILAIGTGTRGPQESNLSGEERESINKKSLEDYVSADELDILKEAVSDRLIIKKEEEFLYNIQDTKLKQLTQACYNVKTNIRDKQEELAKEEKDLLEKMSVLASFIRGLPNTLKQALNKNESFPKYVTPNQPGLQLNPEKSLGTSKQFQVPKTLNPQVSSELTTVLSLPVELAGDGGSIKRNSTFEVKKKTLKRNPTSTVYVDENDDPIEDDDEEYIEHW